MVCMLVFYERQMYQINVRLEIANMGKLIVYATPRNILVSGRHLHDFLSQINEEYNYACIVKSLNTIVCVYSAANPKCEEVWELNSNNSTSLLPYLLCLFIFGTAWKQ